jgi:restriction system protein
MPVPDYQSLIIRALTAAANGEARIGDVVEGLANQLDLTAEERAELLPSGKQTLFANRVHWAKTYLGKAGLIKLTRRGYFRITDRGRQVMASHPQRIDNTFRKQFAEFRQFKVRSA